MNINQHLKNNPLIWLLIAAFAVIVSGCEPQPTVSGTQPLSTPQRLSDDEIAILHIVTGQTVFVPAYSEIFYGNENRLLGLTTTLAIHNTDLEHAIIVNSVRYYDTDGELVREFIDNPLQLNALATTGFVIESQDTAGGWGANFIVEWIATEPVYEPVIEAVMVSSQGTEGVSFISEGRVISEHTP